MDQATAKPAITPEMKVGALLDAYPDLEVLNNFFISNIFTFFSGEK